MSEVFNSVLKGARSLPFSTLVQLTFLRLNSYFVASREQGANRLASDEQFTPYVDAQIQGCVVKARSMELFFTITYRVDFMSSQGVVERSASTYMTKNAHVERH